MFSRGSGVGTNGAVCSVELMENELVKSMKVIFPLFTRLQKQHQGEKTANAKLSISAQYFGFLTDFFCAPPPPKKGGHSLK